MRRSGSSAGPIDLRSDTVTQPTKQMRSAMAAAEVGDDVLDHDPTMRRLEERVAELLSASAALWTPSGSMGNLIALMSHLNRGDAFLAPAGAHVLDAELGTASWLAGGMPRPLEHDGARQAPRTGTPRGRRSGAYYTLRTTCLLENRTTPRRHCAAPEEQFSVVAAAGRQAAVGTWTGA